MLPNLTKRQRNVFLRRLLTLAAFLRKVPRNRFDMTRWVGIGWAGSQSLSCGTTACALGWAATIPSLHRAGLRLKNFHVVLAEEEQLHGGERQAAAAVFGLDMFEFHDLFIEPALTKNTTPKQEARLIEQFVKNQRRGG